MCSGLYLRVVARGLYTYALEEYGKSILVESLHEKGGIVSVPHLEIFRSHSKKFAPTLEALPPECRQVRCDLFDPCSLDSRLYDPGFLDTGLVASFYSKTHLLHVDIDRNGNTIVEAAPDGEILTGALRGLDRAVVRKELARSVEDDGAPHRTQVVQTMPEICKARTLDQNAPAWLLGSAILFLQQLRVCAIVAPAGLAGAPPAPQHAVRASSSGTGLALANAAQAAPERPLRVAPAPMRRIVPIGMSTPGEARVREADPRRRGCAPSDPPARPPVRSPRPRRTGRRPAAGVLCTSAPPRGAGRRSP